MNKSKRNQTLDSFVIKKPKIMSTIEENPYINQHENELTNATSNSSEININQDITTDNAQEITPPSIHSETSLLSNQNDHLSSISSNIPDDENIDNSLRTSSCAGDKENADHSAILSKDSVGYEELISHVSSLKTVNETIDTILAMFKSTKNAK
ncbi:unnamed protein product [Rotaria magnacalcarata]|uniref:Uncharacterized protein n=3 Tax=Rotaria magnacalcarata TaxID=392030 RepID=A0A8S2QM05_9BILA|nr:unnamed protein product [Rotaria magnacalcarata]